jgi:threonine/homoserine/homoserine lactone efflux protein
MLDPSFFSYVTVMSITPGPNNLLLAASGVNYGFRRTLPMVLGVSFGCAIQCLLVSLLLSWVLSWASVLRFPLAVMGCLYLLWLSWKISQSASPKMREGSRPMSILGAALFQTVNPKAWLMVINVAILFSAKQGGGIGHMLFVSVMFFALNLPCIIIWALMGDRLRFALQQAWKLRLFNGVMGGLMAATALWLLVEEWQVFRSVA